MGGERGKRTLEPTQVLREGVGRFGVDDYYREYYDLYGMDWEVIKNTRRRDFRIGILKDRIAALVFLAFGVTLGLCAWSPQDFSVKEFGPFEWIVGLGGLCLGIGGCVHTWSTARWRKAVIRRYESASSSLAAPELSPEREGVSKQSYF